MKWSKYLIVNKETQEIKGEIFSPHGAIPIIKLLDGEELVEESKYVPPKKKKAWWPFR